jgi:hypothetical protein
VLEAAVTGSKDGVVEARILAYLFLTWRQRGRERNQPVLKLRDVCWFGVHIGSVTPGWHSATASRWNEVWASPPHPSHVPVAAGKL